MVAKKFRINQKTATGYDILHPETISEQVIDLTRNKKVNEIFDEIIADIGNLDSLETMNKLSLVSAINELYNYSGGETNINGLYMNIKAFGAVGDGVANDAPAFMQAYAESNGRPIIFPQGTYNLSAMTPVGGRVHLVGVDNAEIIGFKYTELNLPVINYQNPNNSKKNASMFIASKLAFRGNGNTPGLHIINQPHQSVLHSFFIDQCEFFGETGLVTENSLTSVISKSNFYHNKYAFRLLSCTNILIEGCQFFSPYGRGVDIATSSTDTFRTGGESIKLSNCTFIDGATAIHAVQHNYLVLDSCLIDYFNSCLYMEGCRYGRFSNTYFGHDGTTRTGYPYYVVPTAFGAIYARGYENGAIKKTCGFEAVDCEFVGYNNTIHNTVNLNGNGLTFKGVEEVDLSTCRFTANPDSQAPYHLIIQTAIDVNFNDCKFYAPYLSENKMIAPWVYTNSDFVTHRNNRYRQCFKADGTVIRPSVGNAEQVTEYATVRIPYNAVSSNITQSVAYVYKNKFLNIPNVQATVRSATGGGTGFLGVYQVNVANTAQDLSQVFFQAMTLDDSKFLGDVNGYVEIDIALTGKA